MKNIILSFMVITLVFFAVPSNAMASEHNHHNGNNYYHHTSSHNTYHKNGGTYVVNKSRTEARSHKDETSHHSGGFFNFHVGFPGHTDLRGYQSSFSPPTFNGNSNGSFGPNSSFGGF